MNEEMVRDIMKVEIFTARDAARLETLMNKFFKENPDVDIVKIKYSHFCDSHNDEIFSSLLVYK